MHHYDYTKKVTIKLLKLLCAKAKIIGMLII